MNKELTRRDFIGKALRIASAVMIPSVLLSACGLSTGLQDASKEKNMFISFEITFSKPMDRESFVNGLLIVPEVRNKTEFAPEWSVGDTTVYCRYRAGDEASYKITFSGVITDKVGMKLDGNSDSAEGDPYSFDISPNRR